MSEMNESTEGIFLDCAEEDGYEIEEGGQLFFVDKNGERIYCGTSFNSKPK